MTVLKKYHQRRTVENTRFFQFIKWENAINTENTLQLQYYYNLSDKEDRYSIYR